MLILLISTVVFGRRLYSATQRPNLTSTWSSSNRLWPPFSIRWRQFVLGIDLAAERAHDGCPQMQSPPSEAGDDSSAAGRNPAVNATGSNTEQLVSGPTCWSMLREIDITVNVSQPLARTHVRRVWTAVKDLLHMDRGQRVLSATDDATFSTTLATFFVDKVSTTLEPRYNAPRYNANSDITRVGPWIPCCTCIMRERDQITVTVLNVMTMCSLMGWVLWQCAV